MRRFILRLLHAVPQERYDYAVDALREELVARGQLALSRLNGKAPA